MQLEKHNPSQKHALGLNVKEAVFRIILSSAKFHHIFIKNEQKFNNNVHHTNTASKETF